MWGKENRVYPFAATSLASGWPPRSASLNGVFCAFYHLQNPGHRCTERGAPGLSAVSGSAPRPGSKERPNRTAGEGTTIAFLLCYTPHFQLQRAKRSTGVRRREEDEEEVGGRVVS